MYMKVIPQLKSYFTHLKYTVHPDLNVAPAQKKTNIWLWIQETPVRPHLGFTLTFICRDPDTPVVDPLSPEGCKVGPLWTGLWLIWSVWRSGQSLELSPSHHCWSVFVAWPHCPAGQNTRECCSMRGGYLFWIGFIGKRTSARKLQRSKMINVVPFNCVDSVCACIVLKRAIWLTEYAQCIFFAWKISWYWHSLWRLFLPAVPSLC